MASPLQHHWPPLGLFLYFGEIGSRNKKNCVWATHETLLPGLSRRNFVNIFGKFFGSRWCWMARSGVRGVSSALAATKVQMMTYEPLTRRVALDETVPRKRDRRARPGYLTRGKVRRWRLSAGGRIKVLSMLTEKPKPRIYVDTQETVLKTFQCLFWALFDAS